MRKIAGGELDRMQVEHTSAMHDTCKIIPQTTTSDAYGFPTGTGTAGSAIACSYNPDIASEQYIPELIRNRVAAVVRLPVGTAVLATSSILITKVMGDTVSIPALRVVGEPIIKPTHVKVFLERIV
jgi:hypothetical protein